MVEKLSKRRHILILSSWFPTPKKPFLGNFVVQQASVLAVDYEVSFIRLIEIGEGDFVEKQDFPFRMIDVFYRKSRNPLLTYFSKKKAMRQGLERVQSVDLIHAHVSHPNGWLFRYAKRKLNKALVLTEHGSYFSENQEMSAHMLLNVKMVFKHADLITAVSQFQKNEIRKRFKGIAVHVLNNPVVLACRESIPKTQTDVRFLHVSTLDNVKNVTPIFDALAKVLLEVKNCKLTVVTDENADQHRAYVEQLGISDAVEFVGPIAHEDILAYYQNADCLVMNSRYESFSIVVAEAWTVGIPVISTSVGIAFDMDATLGLNTDGSAEQLIIAMKQVASQQKVFDSSLIQAHASRFSKENYLQHIKSIYEPFFK